jgi:hypothetical protein
MRKAHVQRNLTVTLAFIAATIGGCISNNPVRSVTAVEPVPVSFARGAELSPQEVAAAVLLARRSGITNPASLRTFYFLPSVWRGVLVCSDERSIGRDIFYDTLEINREEWSGFKPSSEAGREGSFWTEPSSKVTTHLRYYEIKKGLHRVVIGNGVDVTFADKVMAALVANRVQREEGDPPWEQELSAPEGIYREQDGKYELRSSFHKGVIFKFDRERIIVTGIVRREI